MSSKITLHFLDGGKREYYRYSDFVEESAAAAMPLGWVQPDDAYNDREFVAQCDRYATVEMEGPDDEYAEVITFDGVPIATVDDPLKYGIEDYEPVEARLLREATEEAQRNSYYDMLREERALERAGTR